MRKPASTPNCGTRAFSSTGAGTVTQELESGSKLVVRFDSGVQKQLLARFVSDE